VPTDNAGIGDVARNSEPFMRQVFVTGDQDEEILKRQVTGIVSTLGTCDQL
jgi:Glutamate synthase domain 1